MPAVVAAPPPPPVPLPLPGHLGLLTEATMFQRLQANAFALAGQVHSHGDNGYAPILPGERHGPVFIVGCASAWATDGAVVAYAHCSSHGWAPLVNSVAQAGIVNNNAVTQIRVTRTTELAGPVQPQDLLDGADDTNQLQLLFPNAAITRWFVERGVTTYFDFAGNPTPW
ncbi:MAG: hypothetical protein QM784_09105 [Polyangiaceae bacterium]